MGNVRTATVDDFTPDDHNANTGTERGTEMLDASLAKLKAGRSALADKNGRLMAGNKTVDAAKKAGITRVVVVETTGDELVVVQRTDLDLDTAEGRMMAYSDNRVGEVNLAWDPDVLRQDLESLPLDDLWMAKELQTLINGTPFAPALDPTVEMKEYSADDMDGAAGKLAGQFANTRKPQTVMCPHCGTEFEFDA